MINRITRIALPLAVITILVEAFLLARMKNDLAECRREFERFRVDARCFGHIMACKQIENRSVKGGSAAGLILCDEKRKMSADKE